MSKVEVWHPRTAQKSYGKEKRMLNPPPTLRVSGPLYTLLTAVTLSSTLSPEVVMSSQTHHVPLVPSNSSEPKGAESPRRSKRDHKGKLIRENAAKSGFGASLPWERRKMVEREREILQDGLTFPGLWVGEEVGKGREFKLELKLGQPGQEGVPSAANEPPTAPDQPETAPMEIDPALEGDGDAANGEPIADMPTFDVVASTEEATAQSQAANTPYVDDHLSPKAASQPTAQPESDAPAQGHAWASLLSGPLSIVSKPSVKTAKARSLASCLTESDAFSLFVRINSQTVRTKFMKLEDGDETRLTSRTGKWTPFRFEVLRRAGSIIDGGIDGQRMRLGDDQSVKVLTYGSIVRLVGVQNGVKSDPVKVVKVDKNEVIVGADEGHPISELQRVGFVRMDGDQEDLAHDRRWFLSAPGARAGGGELLGDRVETGGRRRPRIAKSKAKLARPMPETLDSLEPHRLEALADTNTQPPTGDETWAPPNSQLDSSTIGPVETEELAGTDTKQLKRRKTKRNALAAATLAEEQGGPESSLSWHQAERVEKEVPVFEGKKETGKRLAIVEQVEDWMCWVITGVASFSYTILDGTAGSDLLTDPSHLLDPVPRVLADPIFHPESNTLDIVLTTFQSQTSERLDVYLGPIGPLSTTTWRSTAPDESNRSAGSRFPAIQIDAQYPPTQTVYSTFPQTVNHVLVVVEMPSPEEIIRVMQDCVSEAKIQSMQLPSADSGLAAALDDGDDSWLPTGGTLDTGEMTIQEALKNAEDAFEMAGKEMDLSALETQAIDPSLRDIASAQAIPPEQVESMPQEENAVGTGTEQPDGKAEEGDEPPTTLRLVAPDAAESNDDMVPLPLLLIRKDGVGFGIGRSVVAQKISDVSDTIPRWGLKVVAS